MSHRNLESLETWKKAQDFAVVVYRDVLPLLPGEEKWGLKQQIRRAAASIPANIAEGYGRYYFQENVRFCYYARGSLEETLSHVALSCRLEYLPEEITVRIEQEGEKLLQLLNGYINYLKRSKQGTNEPGANIVRETSGVYEFLATDDPNT